MFSAKGRSICWGRCLIIILGSLVLLETAGYPNCTTVILLPVSCSLGRNIPCFVFPQFFFMKPVSFLGYMIILSHFCWPLSSFLFSHLLIWPGLYPQMLPQHFPMRQPPVSTSTVMVYHKFPPS